jgi:hypothetical protein
MGHFSTSLVHVALHPFQNSDYSAHERAKQRTTFLVYYHTQEMWCQLVHDSSPVSVRHIENRSIGSGQVAGRSSESFLAEVFVRLFAVCAQAHPLIFLVFQVQIP